MEDKTIQAVKTLSFAEHVVEQYEEVEYASKEIKKPFLQNLAEILTALEGFYGLRASDAFINKMEYYIRYIKDTLFIEGYSHTIQ